MKIPYVVIMAGGRGERFWPKSRLNKPKHLLPIVGTNSMLAQTLERLKGFTDAAHTFIITQKNQKEAILKNCPSLRPEQILIEPMGKDTAAAIALALAWIKAKDPNAVFCVLPADHAIHNTHHFITTLQQACHTAETLNGLVTIGIPPTYPATGYGYIQKNTSVALPNNTTPIYNVKQFVEKPTKTVAETYIQSGEYLWNAGMFVWKVSVLENAFRIHSPIHAQYIEKWTHIFQSKHESIESLNEDYATLPKISIDYAIMEKATPIYTLEATFDWDDVGEWTAIERHTPKTSDGNTLQMANLCTIDAKNNIIMGESTHLIAILGVNDLIVIQTPDATLICPKNRAQEIKNIVKKLETEHPEVL